jgi:hypothetical protein
VTFQLAEVLHKTIAELGDITVDEFTAWVAYFKVKEKKAAK